MSTFFVPTKVLSVGNIEALGAELRLEGGVAVRHGPQRVKGIVIGR